MKIACLCNAGLTIEYEGQLLCIDLPNENSEPFVRLSDPMWGDICSASAANNGLCGFFYTHEHPDHIDKVRLNGYLKEHPDTPVYIPGSDGDGCIKMGPFSIEYHFIEHAPIPMAPPHVTAIVSAGGKAVYIAADAKLDCDAHRYLLRGRKVDAAFWNSMYLSRPETRELLHSVTDRNYIYHMPLKPDGCGIWNKLEKNIERYGDELKDIRIISSYPMQIDIE